MFVCTDLDAHDVSEPVNGHFFLTKVLLYRVTHTHTHTHTHTSHVHGKSWSVSSLSRALCSLSLFSLSSLLSLRNQNYTCIVYECVNMSSWDDTISNLSRSFYVCDSVSLSSERISIYNIGWTIIKNQTFSLGFHLGLHEIL